MDEQQKPEKADVPTTEATPEPIGPAPEQAELIVTAKDVGSKPTNNYRLYFKLKDGTMTERTVRAPSKRAATLRGEYAITQTDPKYGVVLSHVQNISHPSKRFESEKPIEEKKDNG